MIDIRLWFLLATALLVGCGSTSTERRTPLVAGRSYLEQPEVLAACRQSTISIQHPLDADELFIDSRYLKYLAGWTSDRNHVQHPELDRVVLYALGKGLTALETDMAFGSSRTAQRSGKITRITVQPAHTPACKAFRHSWWVMPELRRVGLSPDHCVAVEEVDGPTAPIRVVARSTKVYRIWDEREWFALWRIESAAGPIDRQGQIQPAIQVVDHAAWFHGSNKGYGGWAWGCADGNVRAKTLDKAVAGRGNPLLRRPEMIVVPASETAVQESMISESEFSQLRWLERERCAGGALTFDAAGTVWIEDVMVGKELRTALHVLRGDRLLVAPLPAEFPRGIYLNQSALHFKGGFAVNLTRSFKNDESRRLVVFDESLRHIATWKVTPQQGDALIAPDPAKTNRCTDVYYDQFQRASSKP